MKVDFLVLGTQKGGTSALTHYLRAHPQVCYSDLNECHFFDDEENFTSAEPDYSAYHQHFRPGANSKVIGECSPTYLWWESVPERVFAYNPAIKLVVLLRNPIERAFSHWNMIDRRGWDRKPFFEALQLEDQRAQQNLPLQTKPTSYRGRGYYAQQLKRWFALFPRKQFLILKSEDLRDSHAVTLSQVLNFLGVEDIAIEQELVHARRYDTDLDEASRKFLSDAYRDEVRALEQLLGWDCSDWLDTFLP